MGLNIHTYNKIVDDNGFTREQSWLVNGLKHRNDGPALIKYENGMIIEIWYQNGIITRIGGPAYIETVNGRIVTEVWYLDGEIFRGEDKPAFTNIKFDIWYVDGKIGRRGLNGENVHAVYDKDGIPVENYKTFL